jgi:hypothetical protein
MASSLLPRDEDDAALVAQGERFVEIAATFLVAVSLVTIVFYVWRLGPGKLPVQLVRLALTGGLAYALARGQAWARWVTVALVVLTFVALLPPVARDLFRTTPVLESVGMLSVFIGYGIVGRGLLYSRSVRVFFAARRAASQGAPPGTEPER